MQLAQAGQRAGPHQSDVVGDLVEGDGDAAQRAGHLDQAVAVGLSLEVVLGLLQDVQTGEVLELLGDLRAEVSRGVQSSAGCGAANREFADTRQGCLHALDAELDLAGVTAKLLAQGDRNRVHQVGAAGLHNVLVLPGLVQEEASNTPGPE